MAKPGEKKMSRRDLFRGVVGRFRDVGGRGAEVVKAVRGPSAGEAAEETAADELLAAGEHARAAEAFREHLAASPGDVRARIRLGYCLYVMGELVQARCELSRAARSGGDNLCHLYLGLCHARRGDAARAAEAWGKYQDFEEPLIQREINLQLALVEAGESPGCGEMADAVEQALAECRRSYFG